MLARFLAVALISWSAVIPALSRAESPLPSQAVTRSHGIRFTLVVPSTYPRNALARAILHVQNISQDTIPLTTECGESTVDAQVIDAAGTVVYPPALRTSLPLSCPPAVPKSLAPGASLKRSILVILRSARIRAVVSLAGGPVTGRPVSVVLTKGRAPEVSLQTSPDVLLHVRAAKFERSTLLFAKSWGYCQVEGADGTERSGSETSWTVLHPSRGGVYLVRPNIGPEGGCHQPIEWHVVVGFLGEPVACSDFVNPSRPQGGLPALSGSACTASSRLSGPPAGVSRVP